MIKRLLPLKKLLIDWIIPWVGISLIFYLVTSLGYFAIFKYPAKALVSYDRTISDLNSPEFNSKLLDYYKDGSISFYEKFQLERLENKIKDQRFESQLKVESDKIIQKLEGNN